MGIQLHGVLYNSYNNLLRDYFGRLILTLKLEFCEHILAVVLIACDSFEFISSLTRVKYCFILFILNLFIDKIIS